MVPGFKCFLCICRYSYHTYFVFLGILEVLHCVLVESPEALNIIKEGHIKSIISLLDKHGRNHKVLLYSACTLYLHVYQKFHTLKSVSKLLQIISIFVCVCCEKASRNLLAEPEAAENTVLDEQNCRK